MGTRVAWICDHLPNDEPESPQYFTQRGQNHIVFPLANNTASIDGKNSQDLGHKSQVAWKYDLPQRRYLVSVTRNIPTRCELYGVSMYQRLPRISLPLASDDRDLPLDLQQVFTRCWNSGPYPELLHYEESPPGEVTDEELQFCRQVVGSVR